MEYVIILLSVDYISYNTIFKLLCKIIILLTYVPAVPHSDIYRKILGQIVRKWNISKSRGT